MKSTKILLVTAALALSVSAFSQTDTSRRDSSAHKMDTTKKRRGLTDDATIGSQDQQAKAAVAQQAMATDVSKTTTQKINYWTTKPAASSDTNINGKASAGASTTYSSTNSSTTNGSHTASTQLTPKPNFGRYYIPVLGNYNAVATTTDNKSIKITGDETNPGKIWVEGLSGTKFYALLKAIPGTYKVPAQKADSGSVAEGTLIYDENSKQINICVGCGYNDQTPVAVTNDVASAPEVSQKNSKNHHQQIAKVKKVPVISFSGSKAEQGTVSILQ